MLSPRWRKLVRDVSMERGRVLLMVAAVTVSLIAVGTILGAYAVTNREIAASYLGTRPASATLEIPTGVDAALLEEVRKHPAVAEAEARDVIVARMRVGNEWRRTLLFVVDDFDDLRLNLFRSESGAWPPPDGTMLLERLSLPVFETAQGRRVLVKAPHGEPRELTVSGVVHDPGLAPSYMERTGYAYVTRRASSELGESPALRELRIELRGRPVDPAVVRAQASEVAQWVSSRGYPVHQIRIPPPASTRPAATTWKWCFRRRSRSSSASASGRSPACERQRRGASARRRSRGQARSAWYAPILTVHTAACSSWLLRRRRI